MDELCQVSEYQHLDSRANCILSIESVARLIRLTKELATEVNEFYSESPSTLEFLRYVDQTIASVQCQLERQGKAND